MKKMGKIPMVLGIFLLIFIGLVIWRIPHVLEQERSVEVAEYISNRALSMRDVDGNNLPPVPDSALNNSTIEGIDANENNIRDDVELAIFEMYPNDRKVRAAELQYAMAIQIFLTEVFTEETYVAASHLEGRGYGCILDTLPDFSIEEGQERATELYQIGRKLTDEVEELVLNNQERRSLFDSLNSLHATSLGSSEKEDCDLNI